MIRANTKNLAVGYVRRSTDRQEQSIDDQKKAIENYASENRLKLLKFYIDDAISGTSTVKRKALKFLPKNVYWIFCMMTWNLLKLKKAAEMGNVAPAPLS